MKLLALEAVYDMADLLMERVDLPLREWCKGRPGATLSELYSDLGDLPPDDKTVRLSPVFAFWVGDQ